MEKQREKKDRVIFEGREFDDGQTVRMNLDKIIFAYLYPKEARLGYANRGITLQAHPNLAQALLDAGLVDFGMVESDATGVFDARLFIRPSAVVGIWEEDADTSSLILGPGLSKVPFSTSDAMQKLGWK